MIKIGRTTGVLVKMWVERTKCRVLTKVVRYGTQHFALYSWERLALGGPRNELRPTPAAVPPVTRLVNGGFFPWPHDHFTLELLDHRLGTVDTSIHKEGGPRVSHRVDPCICILSCWSKIHKNRLGLPRRLKTSQAVLLSVRLTSGSSWPSTGPHRGGGAHVVLGHQQPGLESGRVADPSIIASVPESRGLATSGNMRFLRVSFRKSMPLWSYYSSSSWSLPGRKWGRLSVGLLK